MDLRRIDALVAEHVMGLAVSSNYLDERSNHVYHESPQRVGFGDDLAHYSSDIAAAWEVVEKLKMYEPEVSWNDEAAVWFVRFSKSPYRDGGTPCATSAPLAICYAALALLGPNPTLGIAHDESSQSLASDPDGVR